MDVALATLPLARALDRARERPDLLQAWGACRAVASALAYAFDVPFEEAAGCVESEFWNGATKWTEDGTLNPYVVLVHTESSVIEDPWKDPSLQLVWQNAMRRLASEPSFEDAWCESMSGAVQIVRIVPKSSLTATLAASA